MAAFSTIAGIGALGASGYSAYKGAKAQDRAIDASQQAAVDAQRFLSNVGADTPFGGGSFSDGRFTQNLGQFGNLFGGLGQLTEQSFFNPQSLPGFLTGAAQSSFVDLGNPFSSNVARAFGGFNNAQGGQFFNPAQGTSFTSGALPPQMRAQYGLDSIMGQDVWAPSRGLFGNLAQQFPPRTQATPTQARPEGPTDFGGPTSMGAANQSINLFAPGGLAAAERASLGQGTFLSPDIGVKGPVQQGSPPTVRPGGPVDVGTAPSAGTSVPGLPIGQGEVAAAQGAVGGLSPFTFNPTFNSISAPGTAGQTAIEQAANQGALNQFGVLNQDPADIGADRLEIMRQLAAPEEQRARVGLSDNLFAQGRLGSTGGAEQQRILAETQSRADLERQLAAQEFGRAVQNDALNRFGTLAGEGRNQGLFSDDLINSNFGRQINAVTTNEGLRQGDFGRQLAAAGFSESQINDLFNRQLGASQFGVNTGFGNFDRALASQEQGLQNMLTRDALLSNALGRDVTRSNTSAARALERFNLAGSLFNMGEAARTNEFNRGISGLGALGSIQSMGLNNFNAALNAAIARSNAAVGTGSNMAELAQTTPAGVQLASGLFSGLGNAGIFDNFGGFTGDPNTNIFSRGAVAPPATRPGRAI